MMISKLTAFANHKIDPIDDPPLFHRQRQPHDRRHTPDDFPGRTDQISTLSCGLVQLRISKHTLCSVDISSGSLANRKFLIRSIQ